MIQTTTMLTKEQVDKLAELSAKIAISRNAIMRLALNEFLQKYLKD
jgi:predicted transcriptional regulator